MFFLYSAIEQFDTRILLEYDLNFIDKNLNFVYTNLNYSSFICIILFIIIFKNSDRNKISYTLSKIFITIIEIINENLIRNKHTIKFRTSFLVLFFFILFNNILGLFPYFFTLTSQFWITLVLSFLYFVSITLYALYLYNIKFLKLFWPSNVPLLILPFLFIIESLSYFSRIFSLSIRLFANIMAGHTLLHIISDFVILFYSKKISFFLRFIFIVPFIIVIFITFLEIGVAALQAYVFLILLCIYLNDIINLTKH